MTEATEGHLIPPDWERHPELVAALRALVEGARRRFRESDAGAPCEDDRDQRSG